jgi:hypothetical protein
MRKWSIAIATCIATVFVSPLAHADITVVMRGWESLDIHIKQGLAGNCEDNNTVVGPVTVVEGWTHIFPGTGSGGDDICWQRSEPGDNNWSVWTRCASEVGECVIN